MIFPFCFHPFRCWKQQKHVGMTEQNVALKADSNKRRSMNAVDYRSPRYRITRLGARAWFPQWDRQWDHRAGSPWCCICEALLIFGLSTGGRCSIKTLPTFALLFPFWKILGRLFSLFVQAFSQSVHSHSLPHHIQSGSCLGQETEQIPLLIIFPCQTSNYQNSSFTHPILPFLKRTWVANREWAWSSSLHSIRPSSEWMDVVDEASPPRGILGPATTVLGYGRSIITYRTPVALGRRTLLRLRAFLVGLEYGRHYRLVFSKKKYCTSSSSMCNIMVQMEWVMVRGEGGGGGGSNGK